MSKKIEHEPLDDLLQTWSHQSQPSEEHLEQLNSKIQTLISESNVDQKIELAPRKHSNVWQVVSYVSIGTSLVLAIALGWILYNHEVPKQKVIVEKQAPVFTQSELTSKRLLVSELERVFADRFAWVIEADGQVHLGVDEESVGPRIQKDSVPIVVRVDVVRRQIGQVEWEPVWSADVVSRSESVVQLSPRKANDPTLVMWTYALPDGLIQIDGELRLDGADPMKSSFSHISEFNDSSMVFTTDSGQVQYEVRQMIALLDEDVI